MKNLLTPALCLAVVLLALAEANVQQDLFSDPDSYDPEFPPRMWTGSIESGDASFNYIAYLADGRGPHPTAVLLHGFPGNEKNLDLAQGLRRVGWNAVFMNYRGSWGSMGEYSVENANEDVDNALAYLRVPEHAANLRVDPRRIALVGHSFGGFKALYAAANSDAVTCAAALAFSDIGHHVREVESGQRELWPWIRATSILKGFTRDEAWDQFIRNRDEYFVMEFGPRLLATRVLIVTPEFDGEGAVARQLETAERFEAAGVDVTFRLIEGADHSFSARRWGLIGTVATWLNGACLGGD